MSIKPNKKRKYSLRIKSKTIEWGGDHIDATRGCFAILDIYFEKMKEIGIYDNSTIILLGDHGADGKTSTSLLLKPKGATGSLQIDTEAELSDIYFGASILEAAGIPHDEFGISYFDIIGGLSPVPRILYEYCGRTDYKKGGRTIDLYAIYEVTGNANDADNWRHIEK